MTAPAGYIGERHLRLAAIHCLVNNVPPLFVSGGEFFADQTKPTVLPTVPTTFSGPYSVIPTDGSYFFEPPEGGVQQNPIPWICVEGCEQYNRDRADDNDGVLYEFAVGVRARVSVAHADAGGPVVAKYVARMRAECLAQAGLFALMRSLGTSCRVLDPTAAFQYTAGGFVDRVSAREVLPSGSTDGQETTIFDGVGTVRCFIRLYEQGRSA